MRRHLLWIVFGIVVGLSACATPRCPPPAGPQAIAPPINTTKACASWQWIGVTRPGSECPQVAGWTVNPLFKTGDSGNQQQYPQQQYPYQKELYPNPERSRSVPDPEVIQELEQELERFCVYTIGDPNKKLQDVPFPPVASPDLVRFDQDCAIISTSANEYMDQTSGALLREHFLKQVGRAGISPTFHGTPNVRLVFLDTHPTDEGPLDRPSKMPHSWHGYTLVQIARDLVHTPDGQRAARVTTQLALPIVSFNPKNQKSTKEDPERGGFIGTQSHLAKAITEAVDRWQREGPERRLVLNLSVAWDGELFGGLDEESIAEVRAGTQAVYRALHYAAGHDVLVLAAAGNQRTPCARQNPSGSCPQTGLLLPAAWEEKHPADRACPPEPPKPPLLYAVGGTQSDGTRLDNARDGAMTRRAAYGEYPVVASFPHQPTKIYVGSSVATAVVSSTAAAVWNSLPDLNPHQVMEILENSGKDLGDAATYWRASPPLPSPVPGVRKITFCEAVKAACLTTSAPCPIQAACPSWTQEQLALPIRFHTTGAPKNSCQPWVFPQPEDFPCLGCPPKSGSG